MSVEFTNAPAERNGDGFPCPKCKRLYPTKKAVKRHLNRKTPCDISYKCPKCSKLFKRKSHLDKHLKRKTPCELIVGNKPPEVKKDEIKCKFCGRDYSNIYTLRRHMKQSCKIKNNGMQHLFKLVMEENMKLKSEVKEIKTRLDAAGATNVSNVANIGNINNITVTNIINVKDYMECPNYTFTDIARMARKTPGPSLISKMVEDIHFNPDRPENHNIYCNNIKVPNKVLVYENKWVVINMLNLLDDLFDKCKNKLIEVLMQNQDFDKIADGELSEPQFNRMMGILQQLCLRMTYLTEEEHKEEFEKLKETIKDLIVNNRDIIERTWRNMGIQKITVGQKSPELTY